MSYSTTSEGPKIELNEPMRPRLEKKLNVYRRRIPEEYESLSPEELRRAYDAMMKIAVLETLLREGVVYILSLSESLSQEKYWSPEVFTNACEVIDAYNEDTAGILRNGTGLPEA